MKGWRASPLAALWRDGSSRAKMRILVDAMPLRYGGGVTYVKHQLDALSRIEADFEIHTLISPWTELGDLPGTHEVVRVRSVPHRFAYEQLRLPLRSADIVYCPANFAPLVARAPVVLTIHNPNYYRSGLALPEVAASRPPWKVKANHLAMKRAAAIIAISDAIADEAKSSVSGVSDTMHVIHSGGPDWGTVSTPVPGLPSRYVTVVASEAPHKRVRDVVAGWALSLDRSPTTTALVLVGGYTEDQVEEYTRLAREHREHLILVGRIADRARIKWIYEHALALVSMSLLEAFPLTPAEAGSVGCPLVLSDIPPHREVTAGRATFVPTGDVERLAGVLAGGVYEGEPGSRPWEWGTTWDDNARMLAEVFHEVARMR